MPCSLLIIMLCFTFVPRKIWSNIRMSHSKYQDHDCVVISLISLTSKMCHSWLIKEYLLLRACSQLNFVYILNNLVAPIWCVCSNFVCFFCICVCICIKYEDLRIVVRESPHSVQIREKKEQKNQQSKFAFLHTSYLPGLLLTHIWTFIENGN